MIRQLVCLSMMILLGLSAKAAWIPGNGGLSCGNAIEIQDYKTNGGPIIWPWGEEVTFPWNGIQGLWQVSGSGCTKIYMFKVAQSSSTEKVLDIVSYDPTTCRVSAVGKGVESARVLRAVLTGRDGAYELTIHAFRPLRGLKVEPVMVMRLYRLGGHPSPKMTFKLDRLEKSPSILCQ